MAKLILILLCCNLSFANEDRRQMIEDFLKQRDKIMKGMVDSFGDDSFFSGQSMFSDDLLEKFDKNLFGQSKFATQVTISQVRQENGDIMVSITPKSKNIKLDIQTTDDLLTVTSKTLMEQEDESDRGKAVIKSMSSSSQSIAIPTGYKLSSPKAQGDSVVYIMSKEAGDTKSLKPLDIGDSI